MIWCEYCFNSTSLAKSTECLNISFKLSRTSSPLDLKWRPSSLTTKTIQWSSITQTIHDHAVKMNFISTLDSSRRLSPRILQRQWLSSKKSLKYWNVDIVNVNDHKNTHGYIILKLIVHKTNKMNFISNWTQLTKKYSTAYAHSRTHYCWTPP